VYATYGDDGSAEALAVGGDPLFYWNVMQYCEGRDLFSYIPLVDTEQHALALSYFRDAMQHVHRLHEVGYAHMDLKPEHILFAKEKGVDKEKGVWVVKLTIGSVCPRYLCVCT
jgi:serine/threonine protein kinase